MNPPNPNLYARGTANWNRVAASQGKAAAPSGFNYAQLVADLVTLKQ